MLLFLLVLLLAVACHADGINPCHPMVFLSNAFHVDAFFRTNDVYGVVEVDFGQWRYSSVNETVLEVAVCAEKYNGRYAVERDGIVAMVHYARRSKVLMITNLDSRLHQSFYVKMQ